MAKEIELRAPVSEADSRKLFAIIQQAGPVRRQSRCFIDYSTFLEGIGERKLDVRVRVTNGDPEIIVKKGEFGGSVREEAALPFAALRLEDALTVMSLLGYVKGVAGGRRIVRAHVGDIEVAFQEVLDFANPDFVGDRFVEVEFTGAVTDDGVAVTALSRFLSSVGLRAFSTDEWNAYVAKLNETLNGVYVHGETPVSVIRKLGQ